jgi:hypothetical protein
VKTCGEIGLGLVTERVIDSKRERERDENERGFDKN